MKPFSIAILGGGNMGRALAAGLVKARVLPASRIRVADVRPEALKALQKELKVSIAAGNQAAVKGAAAVLLCVKPQQMAEVLAELKATLSPRQLVISVAAGVRTGRIEEALGAVPVIRVMPNTPALAGAGAMVFCLGRHAGPSDERTARKLLGAAGVVWKVGEALMDAVTALSGSGPAYVFQLAELLAAAGAAAGLPTELAEGLARQTVYGAGVLLKGSPESAATLRERVTSPGGTTAAALAVLNDAGVKQIYERAVSAACRRSRELSEA